MERNNFSSAMRKSIVPLVRRGTMDLRIALEKLSPWRETLSLAKTWWYNYANCSNDPELASFPRSHSSIQNKLNLRFVNTITTNHIYNLVKTRGVYGFFSNLVYLLNNVTAHKIVGNHWYIAHKIGGKHCVLPPRPPRTPSRDGAKRSPERGSEGEGGVKCSDSRLFCEQ